jgi:hypothetical protein
MSAIPALWSLDQEGFMFKARLDYVSETLPQKKSN